MQLNGGDDNGGDGDDGGDDGGDGGGDGRDVGDARTVTEYKKCAQVTMSIKAQVTLVEAQGFCTKDQHG